MGFSDIFKKSFLSQFSGTVNVMDTVLTLVITCVLALYIFFIYRLITRKNFYSKNFNISLVAITIIIAAIIMTIQSNVVISLGMVGALSIVRFRTAIKDPMDLAFLFWSISVGIICGAGLSEIALISSLILTALILLLNNVPVLRAPMILIINSEAIDNEEQIIDCIKQYCKYYKVKSRNATKKSLDIIIEVRVKTESELVKQVSSLDNIKSVSLISHDGEAVY